MIGISRHRILVAAAIAYLALWPVPIDAVAWTPPAAPGPDGPYAANSRLAGVEWLGRGVALGPEATAIDRRGRVSKIRGDGALLHMAVLRFALDLMIERGFEPQNVPVLVREGLEAIRGEEEEVPEKDG